jgi:hypothetical protein
MNKAWAILVTVTLIIAILLPIHEDFRGPRGDSFPFSWYPMFSRPRPDPEWAHYVVGHTSKGERVIIPAHFYVKGSMNQARRQLDHLVREGRTAHATCEQAATRIARSNQQDLQDVVSVNVVRGYFYMEEYFGKGNKQPVRESIYARCRVMRGAQPQTQTQSQSAGGELREVKGAELRVEEAP